MKTNDEISSLQLWPYNLQHVTSWAFFKIKTKIKIKSPAG